eukprot:227884-Pleurochrysis_carterae.AAC.1
MGDGVDPRRRSTGAKRSPVQRTGRIERSTFADAQNRFPPLTRDAFGRPLKSSSHTCSCNRS